MINSMEKLIYQMFILGFGTELERALGKGLGGVIFFTKDILSEEDFKNKIVEIKNKSLINPFLSIDQEGGRVERTENIRPRRISPRYAYERGEKFLRSQSLEISKELNSWGINLNFAPCADVNTNPNNPIIGERSFSNNADDVIKGVEIFSEMSKKCGVIPCVKHFPGHGDADKDSHLTLPVIDLPLEEMKNIHIKPFAKAIEQGADMVMVAHLYCKCFDKEVVPSSLSKNVVGYLREQLAFGGVVISDDMVMKGVQNYGGFEACRMGIEAGLDMFIYRQADDEVIETIDKLVEYAEMNSDFRRKVVEANERIKKLKSKYGI